ncbi:MAG: hypothetical protein ACOYOB_20550 [Myxococcota bacterium]
MRFDRVHQQRLDIHVAELRRSFEPQGPSTGRHPGPGSAPHLTGGSLAYADHPLREVAGLTG